MMKNSQADINIIHIDPDIVVVEKPGGLLAVPGRGPEKQDCVVNRIRRVLPDIINQPAVHRLDMDTSGVMILARTKAAHRILSTQFERRQTHKKYIALLNGTVDGDSGRIELQFRLDIENRPYQIYDPVQGKTGITLWKKLSELDHITRVEFIPLTGRTHQLRVHAAYKLGLNAPIVGDRLYGHGDQKERMMLHATSLSVTHPRSGEERTFLSNVPF